MSTNNIMTQFIFIFWVKNLGAMIVLNTVRLLIYLDFLINYVFGRKFLYFAKGYHK